MKERFRKKNYSGKIKINYVVELENGSKIKELWETDQGELINHIVRIVDENMRQGIRLTLRQLYYELLGEGLIPNAIEIYRRIGSLVSHLRYTGHIDWDAIEDRARVQEMHPEWENVYDLVQSAINSYRLKRWEDQNRYAELLTEKDAMYSKLFPITDKYHIRLCINKGYSSSSVIYELSRRIWKKARRGKEVILFYVGDHDPSGLDMIRDIGERIEEFIIGWMVKEYNGSDYSEEEWQDLIENQLENFNKKFHILPIALTMAQIKKYNLPPAPAKISDPRAKWYIKRFGHHSWEVDALKPVVMNQIVEKAISSYIDLKKYNAIIKKEDIDKRKLDKVGKKLLKDEK